MSLWSLTPQLVAAAPTCSQCVHNGTLGPRHLMEKPGAAGSRDEALTPLSVSLILPPACTSGGDRQIMSWEERERDGHSHSGDGSILPGWLQSVLGLCRRPGLPVRAPVCTLPSAVPFLRPRVLTAVSVLCILSTAQLRQDEFSNQVEGGCLVLELSNVCLPDLVRFPIFSFCSKLLLSFSQHIGNIYMHP